MSHRSRRAAALAAVVIVTLVGTFVVAFGAAGGAQAAAPQVAVVGGAAIPTHAPSTDQLTYTISVGDAAATEVVLHAVQPQGLPASTAGVEVDGSPARPGTVDQVGSGLRVRLGRGANAAHGGALAIGNHTVTFSFGVPRLPQGPATARAVVDYVVAGQTRHVESRPISLALPDLALTRPAGGANRIPLLGTGVDGDFETILSNSGGGARVAALTVRLPVGLKIDRGFGVYRDNHFRSPSDAGGVRLSCSTVAAHVVRCELGAVPAGTSALIDIPVQPTPVAPVGRLRTFTVTALAGNGLEALAADNVVRGSVRFTGTAHLVVAVNPHALRLRVGRTGRIVITIRNAGPDPAPRSIALVAVRGWHFTMVRFGGKRLPASSRATVPWRPATIRPGHTARVVVRLKARSTGRNQLLVGAGSAAGDPPCDRDSPSSRCQAFGSATLIATKRSVSLHSSGFSRRALGR